MLQGGEGGGVGKSPGNIGMRFDIHPRLNITIT